jgi:hypothetical protein
VETIQLGSMECLEKMIVSISCYYDQHYEANENELLCILKDTGKGRSSSFVLGDVIVEVG